MGDEDTTPEVEPERVFHTRTPQPPKKPLADFLAEFEARLRDHPDEPATTAGEVLDARAEGTRRSPVEGYPERRRGHHLLPDPLREPIMPPVTAAPPAAEPPGVTPVEIAAPAIEIPVADPPPGAVETDVEEGRHRRRRHKRRHHH
ncbi:MAG: hypothetical protein ACYDGR_02585 [Candidatus Dormibacteria bacterium]